MSTNNTIVGIDIGTQSIKIVIAESVPGQMKPRILHATTSPSHGFRHGYVVDLEQAVDAFHDALAKSERETQMKIHQAYFSIGGVGLTSQYVRTSIDTQKKNSEITEKHVDEVVQKAEELFNNKYPNKKILHVIPVKYSVDHRDVLGTPSGMYGQHLEVKIIFVTIPEHHYESFVSVIESSKISALDIIATPIADATASLSQRQRTHGCMISNIGADTTSSASFENGVLSALEVLPIGSNDVTNDIALGLQISIEEAEEVKLGDNDDHPKRKLEEIISARVSDILELLEKFLVKINKNRLLPAGVIFSGGGALIKNIDQYAKLSLRIPAHCTELTKLSRKTKKEVKVSPQFSVAYGLCCSETRRGGFTRNIPSFKKIKKSISYWLGQIMP